MPAEGASDAGPAGEAKTEERLSDDDRERIALAIQQPWAELILRGIKTLEIRSQPTRQRGTILFRQQTCLGPAGGASGGTPS